ncbi:MAG: MFS transporter [Lachnospiraceae bacterium]|nr:MFS transporter [Lachnospiraceae bacterium]
MKKNKIHPAWWILTACIMIQAGTIGILNNCMGLFYPSICEELQIGMGEISLFSTITQLVMALSIPYTVLLLKKKNMKYYLLAALLICSFCFGVKGWLTQLYQFYIVGAVMGVGASLTFGAAISVLINNWFKEKKALAFGIVFAASGVSGAVFNPICSRIILWAGWRAASWIMAGISTLMTVPLVLFVVKRLPQEKGVLPYGEEEQAAVRDKAAESRTVELVRPGLVLACCMAINFICCWLSQYLGHLVTFAESVGASLIVGSTISSCSMLGNVLSKVGLGALGDKKGYRTALHTGLALTAGSFLLFIIGGANTGTLYAGGFFYGSASALASVIPSTMAAFLFAQNNYEKSFGKMQSMGYLGSAVAFTAIGYLYDWFDSYSPSFILALILILVIGFLGIVIAKNTKVKKKIA